jgi:hypothetical protein
MNRGGAPMATKAKTTLVGKWFAFCDTKKEWPEAEGEIMCQVSDDAYLVRMRKAQIYTMKRQPKTAQHIVYVKTMVERPWIFFDSEQEIIDLHKQYHEENP